MLYAAHVRDAEARRAKLLECLARGSSRLDGRDVAFVFAHPDDETIASGAQIARMPDAMLVMVTDGAPRDLADAHAHGFDDAPGYARARHGELVRALAAAGMPLDRVLRLEVPDQQAALRLAVIARALAELFIRAGTRIAVTHAYEGGHPDHDATAFAVHSAARLAARSGHAIAMIETPLYHLGRHGIVRGRFVSPSHGDIVVRLTTAQLSLKRRMREAHATQAAVLASFPLEEERFRAAPTYLFSVLPNAGRLLYELHDWGLDGARWQALSRAALAELAWGNPPC